MKKNEIISFFNKAALTWDMQPVNEKSINEIFDIVNIDQNSHVLDIACGTGVLFPFYSARKINKITGIDFSSEMISIAQKKYPDIKLICGDASEYHFDTLFDVAMIYNAFPHFIEPITLLKNISYQLKNNGRIIIAHGASRNEINKYHEKHAAKVSYKLIEQETLKKLLSTYFCVDICISDDSKYIVSGLLKGK